MDGSTRGVTRRSLHAVAELVLAGPQYAAADDIRLRVVEGGFATVAGPGRAVVSAGLRTETGIFPLVGTVASLAAAAGVQPRGLEDVYSGGLGAGPDQALEVDPAAADEILAAFGRGDEALRQFAPGEQAVLWPEHFDIGVSLDEVNYGVSPGDDFLDEPYAYVGPWTPREGDFWNAPFGSVRPMAQLPAVDDVLDYFSEGARLARSPG